MEKKLFIGVCVGCLLVMGYFGYVDRKERLAAERKEAERILEVENAPIVFYNRCLDGLTGYFNVRKRNALCNCLTKEFNRILGTEELHETMKYWTDNNPVHFVSVAPKSYERALTIAVSSCEFSLYY